MKYYAKYSRQLSIFIVLGLIYCSYHANTPHSLAIVAVYEKSGSMKRSYRYIVSYAEWYTGYDRISHLLWNIKVSQSINWSWSSKNIVIKWNNRGTLQNTSSVHYKTWTQTSFWHEGYCPPPPLSRILTSSYVNHMSILGTPALW